MKIIYENDCLQVIDKPAGLNADEIPKRVHRIDKETSGVLLIAKDDKALEFLQKQFQERNVLKKYLALVVGVMNKDSGKIDALMGRSLKDKRKQRVYLPLEPIAYRKATRDAQTEYRVLQRFKNYTLIEATPKTGRKHQIRCHLSHIGYPIAGDKLYGFKNKLELKELKRHFLHASYLKITLPDGSEKEFEAELPLELKNILEKLN